MQITQWAFSDEEAEQFKSMEAGLRHVIVRDASYDDASGKYTLDLKDLQDGATARLTYSMFKADESGNMIKNGGPRATLIGLGKAILGTKKGIPFPQDIIGGVAVANVVHREYNGKTYCNVYEFRPDEFDWVVLGSIDDQNFLGKDVPAEEAE